MRRRVLLSSVAATSTSALAGCLSFGGGCSQGRTVTFDPVDPDEIAEREATPETTDLPELFATLIDRILSDEVTVETIRRDPLGWLSYYRTDEGFYEIESTVVDEGEVTGPEYVLRRDEEVPDAPDPTDTLQYADLPFQDRLRVGEATDYRPERLAVRDREREFESPPFVAGYLDPNATEASRLFDGIEESYLAVGEGGFAIDDRGEGTTSARRLTYAAERVADDADEFADVVLEEQGTTLDSPPEEVEELLRTVREEDGRLEVCDEGEDDSNRAATDALESHLSELESEVPGELEYVRYEGEWYRIGVSEWAV